MHKLVILVETPENETAFNDEWPLFLFLAERMPGLQRETTSHVGKVLYGSTSYSQIHELYFDTLDGLKNAMNSEEGRLAGTQLQKMTRGRVILLIADHQEDSLEHIRKYQPAPAASPEEATVQPDSHSEKAPVPPPVEALPAPGGEAKTETPAQPEAPISRQVGESTLETETQPDPLTSGAQEDDAPEPG